MEIDMIRYHIVEFTIELFIFFFKPRWRSSKYCYYNVEFFEMPYFRKGNGDSRPVNYALGTRETKCLDISNKANEKLVEAMEALRSMRLPVQPI